MDPFASKSSDEDASLVVAEWSVRGGYGAVRGGRGRPRGSRGAGGGGGGKMRETGRLVDSTQAEDRRMIALVAARPLLFARSTLPVASYYTQVKRLWQEVADIMGWTVAEVRRKWSHIRNSYSRHLRNEIHGMRTGRGRMVSKWYLADELEFLRQHMATDTRPSQSQYSMISMPPSLLDAPLKTEAGVGLAARCGGAWYSAPEPAPDDSCGSPSDPDEDAAYFHFFKGIYKDYQELPPSKQRLFRRNCLVLLHELVDGEGGRERAAGGEDTAMNLSYSGYNSEDEKEQKFFVQDLKIVNCSSNIEDATDGTPNGAADGDGAPDGAADGDGVPDGVADADNR